MYLFRQASFYVALVGLALVAALVMTMAARKPPGPPQAAPPTKPYERGLGASGIVEANDENTVIGVPASGVIEKVFVKVWDRVKAGDPLLQLDGRELRAQLPVLDANVQLSEAKLAQAQDLLDRQEKLHVTRVASEQDYITQKFNVQVAQADLASARATAQQTRLLLERLTVRSPVTGTVLYCDLRNGEFLNMATTAGGSSGGGASASPLVVGDIDTLQVRANVDEQVAQRVVAGTRATGYVKGDSSRPIPLQFVRVEPYVQPKQSLTGASDERVDTRVLQVIYQFRQLDGGQPVYVGQQLDVFIAEGDRPPPAVTAAAR